MGLTRNAKLAFISIFFSLAILLALSIILVAVIDLRDITEKQGNSIGGDIDDCAPNPCQNGGACTDGVDSYSCSCVAGLNGTNCETKLNYCLPNPCQNGGNCTDGVKSYNCSCVKGFNGKNCENDIDDCAPNPCQNGGACTDGVDSYSCSCVARLNGTNCETNIDDCSPNPCLHRGTCIDGLNSHSCLCVEGFGGNNCENGGLANSTILGNKPDYLAQLKTWLSPVLRNSSTSLWHICWHGNSHWFAASTFHSRCDYKGPTVTIVSVGSYTFGGYTDHSWVELDPGSIRSHSSNKAFLFTLYNTHGYRPQKLSLIESKSDHATYSRNDVGPLFGFNELLIVDNANSNTGSKTGTSDVYQAPSGCPRSGFCTILAGSYNSWLVSDIEVFYETI